MTAPNEYVIAVDLGGSHLCCAIVDNSCKIIRCTNRPAKAQATSQEVTTNIIEGIDELLMHFDEDRSGLRGIGMGSPGAVCTRKGVIIWACNFPNLKGVHISEILQKRFNVPVQLGHDVDLAALAENYYGAGKGKEHMVCVTIGSDVGIGMIFNGQLYRGYNSQAGNLSHMLMDKNVPFAEFENYRLGKLVAAGAFRNRIIELLTQGNSSLVTDLCGHDYGRIDARMIFDAARQGDELSCKVIQEISSVLAIGLANVIFLLDPELVVIGGGVALSGKLLFDPVKEKLKAITSLSGFPKFNENIIVCTELGDSSVLVGAAHVIWQILN